MIIITCFLFFNGLSRVIGRVNNIYILWMMRLKNVEFAIQLIEKINDNQIKILNDISNKNNNC